MSKKYIAATVAGLSILAFSIFSFSNALALNHDMGNTGGDPLTSPKVAKKLCQIARSNYQRDIKGAKAKGLSLQLPQEEIDLMVRSIKDYRKQVCAEAAALTSAVKLCKEAKKNYRRDVRNMRAKGLSGQWTTEEINNAVREIKDFRKQVCKEAKEEQQAEKEAPKRALQQQYEAAKERCELWLANKDEIISEIRHDGERLGLSEEEIEQEIKNKDGSHNCEEAEALKKKLDAM